MYAIKTINNKIIYTFELRLMLLTRFHCSQVYYYYSKIIIKNQERVYDIGTCA